MVNRLTTSFNGEALPDFTIKGDIQSDLQSYLHSQKLPEILKIGLYTTTFLDSADLDYSILYRLAEELALDSDRFASDQEIGSLSGEKLWKFSSFTS